MLTNATPTNFPNTGKYAKPQRHKINRAKARWKVCACVKTEPTENQRRSGGGRWSKSQAVPFLAISISSSVQRDVSPASTAPVATHTVSVSEGKLRQRYTTRLISHPPSLSVYTWGLQRPPPSSRTSLPPLVSLSLSLCPQPLSVLCPVYCFPFLEHWTQLGSLTSLLLLSLSFSLSVGESSQLISGRQWRSAEAPPFWV